MTARKGPRKPRTLASDLRALRDAMDALWATLKPELEWLVYATFLTVAAIGLLGAWFGLFDPLTAHN